MVYYSNMNTQGIKARAVFVMLLVSIFCGCAKKQSQPLNTEDKIELEVQEAEPTQPKKVFRWNKVDGVICVLLGYGFNDASFYNDAFKTLTDKYGLEEDGGLIWPLVYPDDFKKGTTTRISDLYTMVNQKKVKGILLLGAPENTNLAIARLQDYWEGKMPYPVFSFFPQDDILGMESTCDFVLDYERSAKEEANSEETTQQIDKSVEKILLNAIKYMSQLPGPLPADDNLHEHVQQIVGKDKKVRRFTDSETGLQSINHFVIEREEK